MRRWLIGDAVVVLVLAFVAVMGEPQSGQMGFNANPKGTVISGGICAGLAILWGVLLACGMPWARLAAIVTTVLCVAAFSWRGILA
ncbi:MAG: hypothetical protein JSV78_08755 [Phycisphaerales bacterium]|nr:MAG: hypothetical protein JSV78_08755 [Phycisphaerales bacterium]